MTQQEKFRRKATKLSNPTPVELPSGKWRCQVMVDGRRISITDPDPEVAHAKVNALRTGLIQSKSMSSITVGEAIDRYISSKDGVLSPATIYGYKKIRRNALSELMDISLPRLTQESVQRAVNRMVKDGASPKSVRNAHGLLSAALAVYAPDFNLHTTLPQKQRYEARIPDMDEIKSILTAAEGTAMELPILLAVWLGLRASEIRGLTWDSIGDGYIHIKRAIVDSEAGPVEKGTKTYSGDRYVRLPDHIRDVIERQPKTGDYLVTLSGQAMYKRFTRLCQHIGLPHYRFHDLRHTAASVAMSIGVPNTYTQARMGHKTDNMLKTVYLHTMRSKADLFADRIDAAYNEILHTNLHTKKDNA